MSASSSALDDQELIAASGLFDAATYPGSAEARSQGLAPIEHYLRSGERQGFPPSRRFDPLYYGDCNADVRETGQNLLVHYLRYGRGEGRAGLPDIAYVGGGAPPAGTKTILVLVGDPAANPGLADLSAGLERYGRIILLEDTADGSALAARWQRSRHSVIGIPLTLHPFEVRAILRCVRDQHAPAYAVGLGPCEPTRRLACEAAGMAVVRITDSPADSRSGSAGQGGDMILETEEPLFHAASLPEPLRTYGSRRLTRSSPLAELAGAIDSLGQQAAIDLANLQRDRDVIVAKGAFNPELYLGYDARTELSTVVELYLRTSRRLVPRAKPLGGIVVRRPLDGFHPLIYAGENDAYDEASGEDPLAHFVRHGKPDGPWCHEVLKPRPTLPIPKTMRVGIHGHFHYPELLPDFLIRLERNQTTADLMITTTDEGRVVQIADMLRTRGLSDAKVRLVPNRGRDLGPFLTDLGSRWAVSYDVVGHFHGKRTAHADASIGERWRTFLWDNLIGKSEVMLDRIIAAFAADPRLGLVFAEDPKLIDWDNNRELAEALAARMGAGRPLPNHLDFPQGTMFWARPHALAPLFSLDLDWEDYPEEPVPIDGTLLHALERLMTTSARIMEYRYATALVADSAW